MKTISSFGKCPFCESPMTGGVCLEANGDAKKGKIRISICQHCLGTGCMVHDENFLKLQEKLMSLESLPRDKRDSEIIKIALAATSIACKNIFLHDYAA